MKWHGSRRFDLAVFLYFALLAVAVLAPLASDLLPFSGRHDLANHVSGIVEARNALVEGQFPIRVAPRQHDAQRYPIFQFYGNFPYTLGGVLMLLTGFHAYRVWKLVVGASLVVGAFFTYRAGRRLTGSRLASVVGGAVFLTSPYLLTDVHGRFAYPELVSFALVPVVFERMLAAFFSRSWTPVLTGAAAWSLLALSHNVTFLFSSLLFGLFFASLALSGRRRRRLAHVAAAYGIGIVLTSWSLLPQLAALPHLELDPSSASLLYELRWATRLGILLAPGLVAPMPLPDRPSHFWRLGLQVGWAVLALVVLAALRLRRAAPGAAPRPRAALATRLLAGWVLVFLLVWRPFNLWAALPDPFHYIQSPYRLLIFTSLLAGVVAGTGLPAALGRALRLEDVVLATLLLGALSASYLGTHGSSADSVAAATAFPDIGRGGAASAYLMKLSVLADHSIRAPGFNHAEQLDGGWLKYPGTLALPHLRAGDALRLAGTIAGPPGPVVLSVSLDERPLLRRTLAPGPFELALQVPEAPRGPVATLRLATDRWLDPETLMPVPEPQGVPVTRILGMSLPTPPPLGPRLDRLVLEAPGEPGKSLLLAADEVARTRVPEAPCSFFVVTERRGLVQLPVLYYPDQVTVLDHGRPVPAFALGRLVGVRLPAGPHRLEVRFHGDRAADTVSAVGWLALIGALVFSGLGRSLHLARRFGVAAAVAVAVAVAVVFGPAMLGRWHSPPRVSSVAASSEAGLAFAAGLAFDGKPSTAWAAATPEGAGLRIQADRPATVEWLALRPRVTSLLEGWQRVDLKAWRGVELVSEQSLHVEDAWKQPQQALMLQPVEADRLELEFSVPVTTRPDGSAVDTAALRPGYSEIVVGWR